MTVVTNAEKVDAVREKGYDDVISFGDKESITKARDARIDAMRSGKASPEYTVKNVSSIIAKAGMMGFVIGITTETITSYKKWKRGEISTLDYLKEILKSGSSTAIITSSVSGIMIPVSKMVTTAGMSSLVTIPIAFILSVSADKVIAPAFARGDYKKKLVNAKYYHSLSMLCGSLAIQMEIIAEGSTSSGAVRVTCTRTRSAIHGQSGRKFCRKPFWKRSIRSLETAVNT